jgi:polar amino acid transport system substrate-binding protein
MQWCASAEPFALTFISQSGEQMLGYPCERLVEDHFWLSLVHPNDRARYQELHKDGRKRRKYEVVYRIKHADGHYLRVRDTVKTITEHGQAKGLSGCTVDITEISDFVDIAQNLLDSLPAMVFLKDTENRILRCNTAAAASIGLTVEQVEGRTTSALFPDEADKYYVDDLDVIRTGQPKRGIIETVATAGEQKKWVCTDKIPYRDADGNIAGVIVFAVDITENKNLENELIKYQETLQSAIAERTLSLMDIQSILSSITQHIPGVIYQFMMGKDGKMSFPYVSESCRYIMEFEPAEVEGDAQFIFSRLHPEDIPRLESLITQSAEALSVFVYEGRFKTKSGNYKWLKASSTPEVQPSGDILWNGLMMDVTDLKEAQDKIKELNEDLEQRVAILRAVNKELELLTHKLEQSYDQALEASRLKSEFVANISHEVRTPISAVIGMSELLLDTKLDDEQKEFTRIVRESAQSLLTIINDILDFSKVEAGKLELENIDVDIVLTVEGCADLLASSARTRSLSLMTYIDPQIPRVLMGDPVRLRQILLNLTSNAIKFTDEGEVTLSATLAGQTEEQTIVRFEVSDTGIGLSESARKHLFRPFVQADGSTSRKYGGTGLGLSISKRLVELMGGTIDVESTLNKGSRFWFDVPLNTVAESDLYPMEIIKPDYKGKVTALVLDQASSSGEILHKYLSAMGISTQSTNDVESANKLLLAARERSSRYDLFFVALGAGKFEAAELVQSMAQEAAAGGTKLIMLASFEEREKIERALKSGFSAYLTKPLRQMQLHETVANVLTSLPSRAPANGSRTAALPVSAHSAQPRLAPRSVNDVAILVAEDNAIMQELAVRQVQKLGFAADAASNGLEVLEAMKKQKYVLILMDCQMPEMDGFEATAAIREIELESNEHVPIIAMTASAMQGDRDHCLESGMDDYLPKPVGREQLLSALQKWLPKESFEAKPAKTKQKTAEEETPVQAEAPLDVPKLEDLYGQSSLGDLLHSFVSETEQLLHEMDIFLTEEKGRELAAHAHQLKGLSAVMAARKMEARCIDLEQMTKKEQWKEARQAYQSLSQEFAEIKAFIAKLPA